MLLSPGIQVAPGPAAPGLGDHKGRPYDRLVRAYLCTNDSERSCAIVKERL